MLIVATVGTAVVRRTCTHASAQAAQQHTPHEQRHGRQHYHRGDAQGVALIARVQRRAQPGAARALVRCCCGAPVLLLFDQGILAIPASQLLHLLPPHIGHHIGNTSRILPACASFLFDRPEVRNALGSPISGSAYEISGDRLQRRGRVGVPSTPRVWRSNLFRLGTSHISISTSQGRASDGRYRLLDNNALRDPWSRRSRSHPWVAPWRAPRRSTCA